MAIYNYVSSKTILEQIYRDTGTQEELPWEDCIVWMGEALDLIGVKGQYVRKLHGDLNDPDYNFTNYRVKLPCDFFKLEQIAVNGQACIPSRYSFHYIKEGTCCTTQQLLSEFSNTYYDQFANEFPVSGNGVFSTKLQYITYDINDSFVTFNIQEGKCCMAYLAYPVDEEGFPMIPDNIEYKKAVTAYCTLMLKRMDWVSGKIPQDVFRYFEREWHWYCGSAVASGMKPGGADGMESLKKSFTKLIPMLNRASVMFKQ